MSDVAASAPEPAPASNATKVSEPVPAPATVKPWESKTMWASAAVAILPLIPGVGPLLSGLVATNPQIVMGALGVLFAGLRHISHGKISLKD